MKEKLSDKSKCFTAEITQEDCFLRKRRIIKIRICSLKEEGQAGRTATKD